MRKPQKNSNMSQVFLKFYMPRLARGGPSLCLSFQHNFILRIVPNKVVNYMVSLLTADLQVLGKRRKCNNCLLLPNKLSQNLST